jgi:hypothetical protein
MKDYDVLGPKIELRIIFLLPVVCMVTSIVLMRLLHHMQHITKLETLAFFVKNTSSILQLFIKDAGHDNFTFVDQEYRDCSRLPGTAGPMRRDCQRLGDDIGRSIQSTTPHLMFLSEE